MRVSNATRAGSAVLLMAQLLAIGGAALCHLPRTTGCHEAASAQVHRSHAAVAADESRPPCPMPAICVVRPIALLVTPTVPAEWASDRAMAPSSEPALQIGIRPPPLPPPPKV